MKTHGWLVAAVIAATGCTIVSRDPESVALEDDLEDVGAPSPDAADAQDACESDEELCAGARADCGVIRASDSCGVEMTADCGICSGDDICVDNSCTCLPRSTEELCLAAGKDCGEIAVSDCGERTVNCGVCAEGQCGERAANVCGCPCEIDGQCWAEGAYSPDNPCLRCDSAADATDWSPRSGESCEDDDPCTENTTCTDEGSCVGDAKDCSAVATECQDANCRPDGSCGTAPKADTTVCGDDGVACTIDECLGGECVHRVNDGWCLIDDVCSIGGAPSPGEDCLGCVPSVSRVEASPLNDGGMCDDGDGLACTVGACSSGACDSKFVAGGGAACYLDGACYAHRQVNPANSCQVCSAQIPLSWKDERDGTNCIDSTGRAGVCEGGVCKPV